MRKTLWNGAAVALISAPLLLLALAGCDDGPSTPAPTPTPTPTGTPTGTPLPCEPDANGNITPPAPGAACP